MAMIAILLSGCADLEQPEVERVATTFATADPAARCALLAPATVVAVESHASMPCTEAVRLLGTSGGEVLAASVWGDAAQVRLRGDTLFLTRTGEGWRVSAAGCRPHGEAPYDCLLEGP